MKTCLLPHAVTYYHRVQDGVFERSYLSPVRLRVSENAENEGEEREVAATLYLFPAELLIPLPTVNLKEDYFVCGACTSSQPPRDGRAFRVMGKSSFDASGKINFLRILGVANRREGEVWDAE